MYILGPRPASNPLSLSLPSVPRLLSQILFPVDKRDMPVVILLLGPTGSGKSTFVKHVAKQQARTGAAGDAKPCPFTPQDICINLFSANHRPFKAPQSAGAMTSNWMARTASLSTRPDSGTLSRANLRPSSAFPRCRKRLESTRPPSPAPSTSTESQMGSLLEPYGQLWKFSSKFAAKTSTFAWPLLRQCGTLSRGGHLRDTTPCTRNSTGDT